MVHTDKIIKDLEFSYEGVFDFKEFLIHLKSFFGRYDYDVDEKVYAMGGKDGLKNKMLKWSCDRKLDDYNHAYVKLKLKLSDYKESESYAENKKVVDGKLKIDIEVEVERDYKEQWKIKPSTKFFRAVYEKYIASAKQKKVDDSVKKVIDNLLIEIKQYFKT